MGPELQNRINQWLGNSFDDKTKEEVKTLIATNPQGLIDAFYTTLSFGTGGMRGLMGVGTNRMNSYTVRFATQGLANYIKKAVVGNRAVAIGYDSRNNSKTFAEDAARVLAGNGITVYLFSELRPTPLVSFACRYHKCTAAIMVTASHNPPQYNGYKVYWNDGAQVLPPHDSGIIAEVAQLSDPAQVQLAELSSPLIHLMGKEVDDAYLDAISPKAPLKGAESLKMLYSSLHGTGITMVPKALQRFGFTNVLFVDEQVTVDGNFPTCKKPNPEEPAALTLGINKLLQEACDIFIATDPDCDRLGVVVRHNGQAVALTGNQIVAIAAEYICQTQKLPEKSAFVKTIVTSELFREIVERHNHSCFDVLTGFKYIAEKIRQWESEPNSYSYVFGGEESYGCLVGTVVRDKDAVSASCLFAQIALFAKQQNKTLVDLLEEIYMRYGVYVEHLISIDYEESQAGKAKMQNAMQSLRTNSPKTLSGLAVRSFQDLLQPSDLPKSDVLIFTLADATKVVVRPSGTEPRIKIYILCKEPIDKSLEEGQKKADAKAHAIAKELKSLFH